MKPFIAILLCTLSCTTAAAQRTYTLEQILDSARQNNIAMRNARRSIESAQEQRREAFTNYFPSISATGLWFNANKGMAQMQVNPGEVIPPAMGSSLAQSLAPEALAELASPINISMMKDGTIAGISATQPLFAGGRIVNGNRLAKIGEQAAMLKSRLSENEVVRTAQQYFWQIVTLQQKMKTIDAAEAMLADIHKDVDVAVRAGVALSGDLLRVQLRQNELKSQRLKLKNGASVVRLLLAQYCGLRDTAFAIHSPEAPTEAPSSSPWGERLAADWDYSQESSPIPEQSSPTRSLSRSLSPLEGVSAGASVGEALATPEYQLLEKQVEATRLQQKMALGERLPSVAVGAGYNYHNLLDNNHTFAMVFATVSIPISAWWGGRHAIRQKQIAHQQALDERQNNAELLRIRIQNAWNNVNEAQQQLALAAQSIQQAKENLRINRDHYRAGTSRMADFLDAQLLYQQACDQHTDAWANLQNKLLEYKQSIGQ